jgi:uncharacterized membrane protein YphA (DoxX/SURF4 family)
VIDLSATDLGSLPMLVVVLAFVSGISFLRYGLEVLFRPRLKEEFSRFGVPGVRNIVGILEILGGTAVLLGLAVAPLGAFGAAGLTLLMFLGLVVRIRIHDAPRQMVPAALLAGLNAALVVLFLSS